MEKSLDRIVIKNLFNRFNYEINLDNGSSVAILSAPNGCGKTTIFKIVDFMFMPSIDKYVKICEIPFSECECFLSNGKSVLLSVKDISPSEDEQGLLKAKARLSRYSVGLGETFIFKKVILKVRGGDAGKKSMIDISKELRNCAVHSYHGLDYNVEMEEMEFSSKENSKKFADFNFTTAINTFLVSEDCDLVIEFIQADRLHNPDSNTTYDRRFRSDREYNKDPLSEACREIREKYYEKIREEFHFAQTEASEALPKRYLQAKKNNVSIDDFMKRWNKYIDDVKKFYDIGLLDSVETILSEEEIKKDYDSKKTFLNVYLESFEETLVPLHKEYDRMKLFTDILNKRNKGTLKEMKYGKKGIEIFVDGNRLDISCLSSGEKHDFIMFYYLIFKAKKGSLVFVDEPEISLHINWQEEYIDRLLEICKINDLRALVATHSPNIVNEHFDLMVERGVVNGSK